jgi:phosphocarrier protein
MTVGLEGEGVEASVVITAAAGLHARPAIKLSKLAKRFKSSIQVRVDGAGEWVDAKSIVRLMALKVDEGRRLNFVARGEDAEAALAALSALIVSNFEDEEPGRD